MNFRKFGALLAGILIGASPLLMAPSGGYPTNPSFFSVNVSGAVNAQAFNGGTLSASTGAFTGNVTLNGGNLVGSSSAAAYTVCTDPGCGSGAHITLFGSTSGGTGLLALNGTPITMTGTTSIAGQLNVTAPTGNVATFTDGTMQVAIQTDATLSYVGTLNAKPFALMTNNATRWIVDANDGGLFARTLVDKGAGSVNAVTVYQNSQQLLRTVSGGCSASANTIATAAQNNGIASCTHVGAGSYSLAFSTAFASPGPACVLTVNGIPGGATNFGVTASVTGVTTTGVTYSVSTNTTATPGIDASHFIICTGL